MVSLATSLASETVWRGVSRGDHGIELPGRLASMATALG